MAGSNDFPVMVTLEGSNRHEVMLVQPNNKLNYLKQGIENLVNTSPNAAEMLHKYRNKETKDTVKEIRVRWAGEGRDKANFPKETILTEDNCTAVLRMMEITKGSVFDVKVESKKVEGGK